MIVVTNENIEGYSVSNYLGIVTGSVVLSKNMFSDFGAGLKSMVGGELTAYTKLQDDARATAMNRMINHAVSLGADAVIMTRFNSSSVMQGASEIFVVGTAVKLVPKM